jgi:hypothetical protein
LKKGLNQQSPVVKNQSSAVRKLDVVRKGAGITGVGVSHISSHISGRLTLAMLHKMRAAR